MDRVEDTHTPDAGSRILAPESDLVPASFSCSLLAIMPRDGAQTLSEVRGSVLSIVCEPCGRRERYDVERLTRQYGWEAKLTDLLPKNLRRSPLFFMSLGRGRRGHSREGESNEPRWPRPR